MLSLISNLVSSLFFLIHEAFSWYNCTCMLIYLHLFSLFLLLPGSLSIRRILLPPTLSCLMSPSWRYIPSFCMHSYCHVLPCTFPHLFYLLFIYIIVHSSFFSSLFLFCFQADLEPLSIYHPKNEGVSAAMGTPMEGFFDGVNIVVEAMAFAFAAMQGVLAETPIPSPKPSLVEKSA